MEALMTRWVIRQVSRALGMGPRTKTIMVAQGAEVASSGSSLTSITSSVLRGKVEDGRVYAVYGKEGVSDYQAAIEG